MPIYVTKFDIEAKQVEHRLFHTNLMISFGHSDSLVVISQEQEDLSFAYFGNEGDGEYYDSIVIALDGRELYRLYFDKFLPNIHDTGILYEGVECLPSRVIQGKKEWVLVDMIESTEVINSMLSMLNDNSYDRWTLDDVDEFLRESIGVPLDEFKIMMDEEMKEIIKDKRN